MLAFYNPKLEVWLAVDASPFSLGAVIYHITEEREERPIANASRPLTPAEKNYSVIEKETLAIIFAILVWLLFHVVDRPPTLDVAVWSKERIPRIAVLRLQRWASLSNCQPTNMISSTGLPNKRQMQTHSPGCSVGPQQVTYPVKKRRRK